MQTLAKVCILHVTNVTTGLLSWVYLKGMDNGANISCQQCYYIETLRGSLLKHIETQHNKELKRLSCQHCEYKPK